MKSMISKKWFAISGAVILTCALILTTVSMGQNVYKQISKNLPIIQNIYTAVVLHYVDEVDHEDFLQAGVRGMLGTLDPYTTYIERESEKDQLQMLTDGNYGGVGLPLINPDNIVTVSEPPFLGTPSQRAGIREGDQILEVDGVSTRELSFDETARRIRGPIGTEVKLIIRRSGQPDLLHFTLVRERIVIEDIRYAGIIEDDIGYILLTRFSGTAGREMRETVSTLKTQGAKKLIIDIRSNPGGVLMPSVEISDLFLPKGKDIVKTKGRSPQSNRTYTASRAPVMSDEPIVVLVNGISASSSEILAGALQDHDRAVILGDTTFGKGLVQSVLELPENGIFRITTAKYYTPSGRCIQKLDYSKWAAEPDTSEIQLYKTAGGRSVYGGGGIIPDITMHLPRISDITIDLRRKSMFFHFAVDYVNNNENPDSSLIINDKMFESFKSFLSRKGYAYAHPVENSLERFRRDAKENGYEQLIDSELNALNAAMNIARENLLDSSREDISFFLRTELATNMFGVHKAVEISLQNDESVQKAVSILKNDQAYFNILRQ